MLEAYDQWKLASPVMYEREKEVLCTCASCGRGLKEGWEVMHDNQDNYFCDLECAEAFTFAHDLEDELETYPEIILEAE